MFSFRKEGFQKNLQFTNNRKTPTTRNLLCSTKKTSTATARTTQQDWASSPSIRTKTWWSTRELPGWSDSIRRRVSSGHATTSTCSRRTRTSTGWSALTKDWAPQSLAMTTWTTRCSKSTLLMTSRTASGRTTTSKRRLAQNLRTKCTSVPTRSELAWTTPWTSTKTLLSWTQWTCLLAQDSTTTSAVASTCCRVKPTCLTLSPINRSRASSTQVFSYHRPSTNYCPFKTLFYLHSSLASLSKCRSRSKFLKFRNLHRSWTSQCCTNHLSCAVTTARTCQSNQLCKIQVATFLKS